jgi:hypothetical protein
MDRMVLGLFGHWLLTMDGLRGWCWGSLPMDADDSCTTEEGQGTAGEIGTVDTSGVG